MCLDRLVKSAPPTSSRLYRDQAMLVMYQNGATLAEVAHEFGLSRQRVHQIVVAQDAVMRRPGPRTWVKP
jgi:hypothetical protein